MAQEITRQDLKHLEKYADDLFNSLGMEVSFTKHFLERANDPRNGKQITLDELIRLFREEYAKWGKKIAQLGPDSEAVLNDMRTNINVPFVLKWDKESQSLDLVSKTIMRKKNFMTPDRKYTVAEDAPVNNVGSGNVAGLGVGAKGEPGRGGPMIRRGKFAGHETFIVPSKIYHGIRNSKKQFKHWESYLGGDDHTQAIREFANKYPRKAVVIEDEVTGAMTFCRYGKDK